MKSIKEQLLNGNLLNVYQYLFDMHNEKYNAHNQAVGFTINECVTSYSKTVNELVELLSLADEDNQDTISISLTEDFFDKEKYIHVNILNNKYVQDPPVDLKIWGGKEDDRYDCPEGHYNYNWTGYVKHYAMSGLKRESLLLNDIVVEDDVYDFIKNKIPQDKIEDYLFAEILFELTFQGYTQKRSEEFWDQLTDRFEDDEENEGFLSYYDFKKMLTGDEKDD